MLPSKNHVALYSIYYHFIFAHLNMPTQFEEKKSDTNMGAQNMLRLLISILC